MASVLKSEHFRAGGDQPRPFNVEDLRSQARAYLAQVQREADALLAAARLEADQIRERALREGREQARTHVEQDVQQAAQQMSDHRCKTAVAACEAMLENVAHDTSRWLASWRDQTVRLAARIAEKVVRREMADRDETLRVWLEEALVAMRDTRDLRVLVHPDDYAVAGRYLGQLAKQIPHAASVEVLPDPSISPGGCVVRSPHGQFDQQLETQLERLVEQLA